MKLSLEEIVKLKGYCVKLKDYELGARMREEEKKLIKKLATPESKANMLKQKALPKGKRVTNWFNEWDKAIKSIKI